VAAVPDAYLEQALFVGDEQRIRRKWAERSLPSLATGLILDVPGIDELRLMADLKEGS
jgi:hypothetical protein